MILEVFNNLLFYYEVRTTYFDMFLTISLVSGSLVTLFQLTERPIMSHIRNITTGFL